MRKRRPVILAALAVVVVLAAAGLYWFQPWKLFTSKTVNDTLPNVAVTPSSTEVPTSSATPTKAADRIVAQGSLVTHEHATTGTVALVRLADGNHQLVLKDLDTSDGPDLRVWLTDRPVTNDWYVFDDGAYFEVGRLKGNKGNQVYDIPAGTDLTKFRSMTIWCKRFAVSFGAAELQPV